jgi:hypothetical protein
LDEVAIELGVFFFLSVICSIGLMSQYRARGSERMEGWLLARKLQAFKYDKRNPASVVSLLKAVSWGYIVMPYFALAGWFGLLLWGALKTGNSYLPALCMVLIAIGYWCICLHFATVQW